jgi:hypothetical protein
LATPQEDWEYTFFGRRQYSPSRTEHGEYGLRPKEIE